MQQLKARLGHAGLGLACLGVIACDNSGQERNFDRAEQYSQILSTAQTREVADLTGLTGTATYRGVGFGEFPTESTAPGGGSGPSYTATSDARLTADFSGGTLSGAMTGWIHEDPVNYTMRGEILISDGQINPDGTFDAIVTGAVERRPTARNLLPRRDAGSGEDRLPVPETYGVAAGATATGTFHDSQSGDRASHIVGEIGDGNMTGGFVARR